MAEPFIDTLRELRHGETLRELNEELYAVVQAVRATGVKGSMMLTITVKPASKGDVGTLMLEEDLKTKLPRLARGSTILFATDNGLLTRQDPRQPQLEFLRRPASVTSIDAASSPVTVPEEKGA
jgi:hypothetical protein